MIVRSWWIGAAACVLAVALWGLLAHRGPATGRAPAQHVDAPGEPDPTDGASGSLRVAVSASPPRSAPEWKLEVRDATGRVHEERGAGDAERVIGGLPAGKLLCTLQAPGFVGAIRRLEIAAGQEVAESLTLRRLGRVSGTVRCDGVPVAGALVHLKIPLEAAAELMWLSPGDRPAGADRSAESDSEGRYAFDGVLPVPGISLVAADFDHAPVQGGPVEVRPGEETTADFTLVSGAHLAGRLVDCRGAPAKGATVNVLERSDNPRVVAWNDEARVRTDADGRFVSPALSGSATRMLKAWIVVDGIQQVIQHETSPPDHGTKDVGTLAPHPGIVQFELDGPTGDPPATLTLGVNGDPPGAGQTIVLTGAAFDRDGRIRLAGLPVGEGSYAAMSGDMRAFADGKFRTTGRDMVVSIAALKGREEKPPPAERLIVDVAEQAEPTLLAVIADGSFVRWRQIEKGNREPITERLSPGSYTLFLRSGDRYGLKDITQVAGQDLRVSIAPDRLGGSVSVLILDEGKPVPGATVRVRGFRKEARGEKVPWARAGEDGRATLHCLPDGTTGIAIVAMTADEDHGRAYRLDIRERKEVTVDLAKQAEGD